MVIVDIDFDPRVHRTPTVEGRCGQCRVSNQATKCSLRLKNNNNPRNSEQRVGPLRKASSTSSTSRDGPGHVAQKTRAGVARSRSSHAPSASTSTSFNIEGLIMKACEAYYNQRDAKTHAVCVDVSRDRDLAMGATASG